MTMSNATPLMQQEELELVTRAQAGDLDARNELVMRHLPFIVSQASMWKKSNEVYSVMIGDLVNASVLAMMHAIKKFDIDRGIRLNTYARGWMLNYMKQCLCDARMFKMPRGTEIYIKSGKASSDVVRAFRSFSEMLIVDSGTLRIPHSDTPDDIASAAEQVRLEFGECPEYKALFPETNPGGVA